MRKTKKYLPFISVSQENTLANKTGSWRVQKPILQRGISPCQKNCLSGQDIPSFVGALREENLEKAYRIIARTNPFPALTGRVCPHPCENECNRKCLDQALAINSLERFVGDWALKNLSEKFPKITKKEKVAIIGSGPAGLSCAYFLRKLGYRLTIFESSAEIGGTPALSIPEFRLPKEILQKEIEKKILVPGIELKTKIKVDRTIFDCLAAYFDLIFAAVGLSKTKKSGIEGEDVYGIFSGLDFLKEVKLGKKVQLGKKVIVIGGGNTAVDAARTAKKLGGESAIFYRRTKTEMPALKDEIAEAEREGIKIQELTNPVKFIARNGKIALIECQKMKLGKEDETGRKIPIPIEGSNFFVEADNIILAIGEEKDLSFLPEDWESQEKIFIGGDAANRAGTVAAAIKSGRENAEMMNNYLSSSSHRSNLSNRAAQPDGSLRIIKFEDVDPVYFKRQLRVEKFGEVAPENLARAEAKRCFSCGLCELCHKCFEFCPDAAIVKKAEKVEINYDYCKGCGICVRECPTKSIVFEQEISKFQDIEGENQNG